MLENLGFECPEAETGEQGLDACQKAMPDVILLDWNMPGLNGIDFVKTLRGMKNGEKPKVIFCTIYNEMPYIKEALAAGADEYIMKPFDADIMESKFRLAGVL
jgi:two-component system chemotaxis response regulator CheY